MYRNEYKNFSPLSWRCLLLTNMKKLEMRWQTLLNTENGIVESDSNSSWESECSLATRAFGKYKNSLRQTIVQFTARKRMKDIQLSKIRPALFNQRNPILLHRLGIGEFATFTIFLLTTKFLSILRDSFLKSKYIPLQRSPNLKSFIVKA